MFNLDSSKWKAEPCHSWQFALLTLLLVHGEQHMKLPDIVLPLAFSRTLVVQLKLLQHWSMLFDVAHVLQLDADQSDGNLNIIGSSYAHFLPMRLLLDFVEVLKKNVYNAYEGSTVLPSASRQSSLFFRANKKVCEEWFSRISEPMMNAGLALQCHDATILLLRVALGGAKEPCGFSYQRQVESANGLKYPQCQSQSLDDNGIIGHFSCITGLLYQAGGQHEEAEAHFIHLFQTEDSLTSMGSDGVQFSIARIILGYSVVSDWKSLESWLLELQTLLAKHAGKSYSGALTTAGNEVNSVQALARFDEAEISGSIVDYSCAELTVMLRLTLFLSCSS